MNRELGLKFSKKNILKYAGRCIAGACNKKPKVPENILRTFGF